MIVRLSDKPKNEEEPRSYRPKSDFAVATDWVPTIINETISDASEGDRARMLLQGAAYVRVGGQCRQGDDPFILMAFYLNKDFCVERYFVFQPKRHNSRVSGTDELTWVGGMLTERTVRNGLISPILRFIMRPESEIEVAFYAE